VDIDSLIKTKNTYEYNNGNHVYEDWDLAYRQEKYKDFNYLLNLHGYDPKFWEIIYAKSTIHQVIIKNKDGNADKIDLVCTKITVRAKKEPAFDIKDVIETLSSAQFNYNSNPIIRHDLSNGMCAEINFADVHLNRMFLAYEESKFIGDYLNKTIVCYQNSIDECIYRLQNKRIDKIIFPIGQDYLNADHINGSTTAGTPQDNEKFYTLAYRQAFSNLLTSIEKLKAVADVHVLYLRGNHDSMSTWTMCEALHSIYTNNTNIVIDSSFDKRKYLTYGNSLIGYSHGDKEKNRIYDLMQQEAKNYWHLDYKYFHTSHLHEESVKTKAGVRYQVVGSPIHNSLWENDQGYINNSHVGYMFIYDKNDGMIEQHFIQFK
jgi:hypothetical protein